MQAMTVVDVHTHVFPTGLPDYAASTGDARWPSLQVSNDAASGRIMRGTQVFRPVDRRCFDLGARLADMNETGVDRQVLSPVPVTLCSWADPALASSFARAQNEGIAQMVASCTAPTRFNWIGGVTLQDGALAVGDLEHGLALGMVGVEIGTEVGGMELDDPALFAFWDAAQRLDVAVFVHPTAGEGAIRRAGQPFEFGLGMLTDTATAATALVFGGVLDSFPDLRIGLAHGCGTFPWALPRLVRGSTLGAKPDGGASASEALQRVNLLVRRLWADTLVFDPAHLPLLMERFGADHLMLGSDVPFRSIRPNGGLRWRC
jgi:aminocarboxymuconate-semialdehyde decarboxylase